MSGKRKLWNRKVASLSALGAGALTLGAANANAGIIYSGVIDQHVGFTSGISQYTSPLLGPLNATFQFKTRIRTQSVSASRKSVWAYGNKLYFDGVSTTRLSMFAQGKSWKTGILSHRKPFAKGDVGGRTWQRSGYFAYTDFSGNTSPFTDKYALFRFKTSATTWDYGWIELSYSVANTWPLSDRPSDGPEVIIDAWAYDNTGAKIKAGTLPPPGAAPEPATVVSTGLAALALGAVGLRRWRNARKTA